MPFSTLLLSHIKIILRRYRNFVIRFESDLFEITLISTRRSGNSVFIQLIYFR